MATNYKATLSAYKASLNGQAGDLDGFVAYLEGQATAEAPKEYGRPKAGTITGRVWAICDELAAQGKLTQKDVLQVGEAEGINDNTIKTQYGHWRRAHKAAPQAETHKAASPVGLVDLAGRVVA